jgi:hypothetical protein
MKHYFLFFIGCFVLSSCLLCRYAFGQSQSRDIVYLKNGIVLKGEIVEQILNTSIKIKTADGNIFVYPMSDIDKITKEGVSVSQVRQVQTTMADKVCMFSFDPLGFITLGPAIYGEVLIQQTNSNIGFGFYAGCRMANLGLATNTILGGNGTMNASFTFPLGVRVYINTRTKADGVFFGPHVEFGQSNFENSRSKGVRAFGADVGYKWVYETGFVLEICDAIGIVQTKSLAYTETMSYGFGSYSYSSPEGEWKTLAFVPYMLSLKLGILL